MAVARRTCGPLEGRLLSTFRETKSSMYPGFRCTMRDLLKEDGRSTPPHSKQTKLQGRVLWRTISRDSFCMLLSSKTAHFFPFCSPTAFVKELVAPLSDRLCPVARLLDCVCNGFDGAAELEGSTLNTAHGRWDRDASQGNTKRRRPGTQSPSGFLAVAPSRMRCTR